MSPNGYRVVQWATGTIGSRALRAVIEHPDLVLAGVYVHGTDKAGTDAGDLCGADRPTANRAVNAVAAVCAAPSGIRTTVDLPQVVASLS